MLLLEPLEFEGVCETCKVNCEHCASGWNKGIDNGKCSLTCDDLTEKSEPIEGELYN